MLKFIPNLMTVTHLSFGVIAIILSFEGQYQYSTLLVLLAMLLDGFDGRVARMLNVTGDFGKELDSLADTVSFGVAPALILYNVCFNELDILGLFLTVFFPVCGVLRLARFNTSGYKLNNYFVGLPITAAGGILSIVGSYNEHFNEFFLIGISILLSYLMISTIKFPNFKKVKLPKNLFIVVPIMICIIYLWFEFFREKTHIVLILIFILLGTFVFLKIKSKINKSLGIEDEDFDDEDFDEPEEKK